MTANTPFIEAMRRIEVPGWLAGERGAALDRFLATGMPSTRLEAWKHTSLAALERTVLHSPTSVVGEAVCPDIASYPGHALVFQNGQLSCQGTYLAKQIAGTLHDLADTPVSYTHLRAHETVLDLVCRLLLEKKKNTKHTAASLRIQNKQE